MAKILYIDIRGQTVGVTEDGRIYGKRKELKQRLDQKGYPTVSLGVSGRSGWKVHRLVALAHIPNPEVYETINHINADKTNNHYTNLEWCSRARNVKLAQDGPVVAKSLSNPGFGFYYPCQADAHREGFQQPNISKCVTGERHSHKGFKWEKV